MIASIILRVRTTGWNMVCRRSWPNYGQEAGQKCGLDSSINKWTRASAQNCYCARGLAGGAKKRRWKTALKRRKVKTSLVVVMILLRVMKNIGFYKLFGDWISVVRFVSHEVWSDNGFVMWHFVHCCFSQIVSFLSLSIWIRTICNTIDLVNQRRHWNQMPYRQDFCM